MLLIFLTDLEQGMQYHIIDKEAECLIQKKAGYLL